MAALVTYKASASSSRLTENGYETDEVYQVSGVSSRDEALEAEGLPRMYDSHPKFGAAVVKDISASGGRTLWEVRVTYGNPSSTGSGDVVSNPLKAKMRISARIGLESESTDIDAAGNPLRDIIGNLFEPKMQVELPVIHLEALRNEKTWPILKALHYTGAVNEDDLRIGSLKIPAGFMRCTGINPASDFTEDSRYVPIAYAFEIKPPMAQNGSDAEIGKNPFQWTVAHASARGFATPSGSGAVRGIFVEPDKTYPEDALKATPTGKIPIDSNGKPIGEYSTVKVRVGQTLYTPSGPSFTTPDLWIASRTAQNGQFISTYRRTRIIPFKDIFA